MKDKTIAQVACGVSFALPLALGVALASPEPYWLDCPEFTAAAWTLGLPHPPGHPLYVLLTKPFLLLPLGNIALRAAVASAVFGAVGALLLHLICFELIRATAGRLARKLAHAISSAAALLAAVCPAYLMQCVRAEVYALQVALVLAALYPLLRYVLCAQEDRSEHPLYLSALACGLGLSNHHFITVVALPAAIPVLVAVARYRGWQGALALSCRLSAVACAGLLPYLFLPLRSMSSPLASLGMVRSLSDFFWVVSAKVYQKSMVQTHDLSAVDRSLNAVMALMDKMGVAAVLMALCGLYVLVRLPRTRLAGAVLGVLVGGTVIVRSVMSFDPQNPDFYGYLLPAVAGLAVCVAALVAVAADVLRVAAPRRGPLLAGLVASCFVVMSAASIPRATAEVNLSEFRATRLLTDLAMGAPAGSPLILAFHYQLFFAMQATVLVDGYRPDALVVNPYFLSYPGYLASMLQRAPRLKELARSVLSRGKLTEAALTGLAGQGPVRIEPWLDLPEDVLRFMLPDGVLYEGLAEPMARADVHAAAGAHMQKWERFYRLLGTSWQEPETRRVLVWQHYEDALFLARFGAKEQALWFVDKARALGAKEPILDGLAEVLGDEKTGPVDIGPFIVGARATMP
ncbi:MAG: DUF2723 domain-containing protein [Myxococcota bacterium]|jgi:hypothetical protein|nr:DUF2723 domain-containing protein [Myxococcota bacterium]